MKYTAGREVEEDVGIVSEEDIGIVSEEDAGHEMAERVEAWCVYWPDHNPLAEKLRGPRGLPPYIVLSYS